MQSERVDARPPPRCPLGILAECDPVWCGPLYTANVESPGLECYLRAIRTWLSSRSDLHYGMATPRHQNRSAAVLGRLKWVLNIRIKPDWSYKPRCAGHRSSTFSPACGSLR